MVRVPSSVLAEAGIRKQVTHILGQQALSCGQSRNVIWQAIFWPIMHEPGYDGVLFLPVF